MGRRLPLVVLSVAACCAMGAAAACSSFSGESPLGEAGVDGAMPGDGGDVVTLDAPTEGARPELGCKAANNILCDDFERDDPVGGIWSGSGTGFPGSFELTDAHAVSPTRSMRFRIAGDAGLGTAALTKDVSRANVTGVRCRFSVYPEVLSRSSSSITSLLRYRLLSNVDSEASFDATLFFGSTDTSIVAYQSAPDAGTLPSTLQNAGALPNHQWNELVLDIDFASRMITLTRGSTSMLSMTTPVSVTKNNGVSITLGIGAQGEMNDYFVDDLVCDARP